MEKRSTELLKTAAKTSGAAFCTQPASYRGSTLAAAALLGSRSTSTGGQLVTAGHSATGTAVSD